MGIIARQSIKASILSFIGVGIGAFTRLFLYTKFLTPSEIGILETIIKLGIVLLPFFIIGSPQVITRFFHRFKNEKDDSGLILTYLFLFFFILIPISSILYFLNKDFIYSFYKEAPELSKYYLLPLLVAISYGGFSLIKSISVVHLRITVPTFFSGVLDRIFVLILLFLYGYFHLINIDEFLYLNIFFFFIIPFLLILFYVFKVIKPKVKLPSFKNSLGILKTTASYNSYLIFGTLSGVIIAAIDVNMIAGGLGTELAGVYTIAFFMGTVIDIPRRSLTNIIYPILNKAIINKDQLKLKNLYQKSSVNQFLVGSFIFTIVWLNIDAIFTVIPNGASFAGGKFVVLFIALAKLFDMLMGVNTQIIELSKYYKFNLLRNISLSILIIILNLYFIKLESPFFGGINGVAFASLLAIIISNLFSYILVLFKEKMQPINTAHFKIVIVLLITFFILYFINIENPYFSITIKTLIISIIFTVLTLLFNISEDFKLILQQFLKKINKS